MVTGIAAISFARGAINTSWSETVTMDGWANPAFIYACPTLQRVSVNSDDGSANCTVVQYRDPAVHNVSYAHIFRDNCTSVTFRLGVTDCYARMICRIDFFD
jgi:hypothetical protein